MFSRKSHISYYLFTSRIALQLKPTSFYIKYNSFSITSKKRKHFLLFSIYYLYLCGDTLEVSFLHLVCPSQKQRTLKDTGRTKRAFVYSTNYDMVPVWFRSYQVVRCTMRNRGLNRVLFNTLSFPQPKLTLTFKYKTLWQKMKKSPKSSPTT